MEVHDEGGLDLSDQMEITKYLKGRVSLQLFWLNAVLIGLKVNTLIEQANAIWDERNATALEDGEEELERMLPLIRLKVISSVPSNHCFHRFRLGRYNGRQ